MELALDEARAAAATGDVPIGAVLVDGSGRIVARGRNRRIERRDPTAHAEIEALRNAEAFEGWRREGTTLYVTLEPCPMCSGAMVLSRIERCVYGAYDPKGGFLGTLTDLSKHEGLNHHFDVVHGVLEPACKQQLQSFFRAIRLQRRR